MQERIDYMRASPEAVEAMRGLERHVRESGLDHRLIELVKTRASQINECAFCIDMHTKNARAAGESEQRLYALCAWRETPFFDERERAALAWTEAVTRLEIGRVPDEVYDAVRQFFDERQLVDLTVAIVAINGWNRLSVAFRRQAGTYQPAAAGAPSASPKA